MKTPVLRQKKWIIAEENKAFQEKISRKYSLSPSTAQILFNRNIITDEEISCFLNVQLKNILDPFLLNDMEKAVLRTYEAFRRREKIIVFGDYDVDGITSVSLLSFIFKTYGLDFHYYIPHRAKEGYGFSQEGVLFSQQEKAKLIITVDCGITSFDEISLAKSLGIDTIVLDHHEAKEIIPPGVAVINPKRKDSKYPFPGLAGVGVTFKFAQALIKFLKSENYLPQQEIELQEHLDLVALGTLADMMPLLKENRILVKKGLKIMENTKKAGLKALLKKIGKEQQPLSESDISFKLAPRINAVGRLGDPSLAVRLLTTEDILEAEFLSETLENHNKERQTIEQRILKHAFTKAESVQQKIIVIAGENWHVGVIGIIASKLVSEFFRPAIVISFADNLGRGSGRSVKGFPLLASLQHCSYLLENFGGHNQAAGITIKRKNFEQFTAIINKYADQIVTNLVPEIFIDLEIKLEAICNDLSKEIIDLAPFGQGNPQPLLLAHNLSIADKPQLLGGKHLKIKVKQNNTVLEAIGFGLAGYYEPLLKNPHNISAVFYPQINNFKNNSSLQLILKDLRV